MRLRAAALALCLVAGPVLAVQPGERLADPALEARARDISQGLRCLVCRNENIDDSDASLARDLRLLVRERLTKGDTDAQAVAFIVDRYGEFVLLRPDARGANLILWVAGPAMLLLGGAVAVAFVRRRRAAAETPGLSEAEERRLAELLRD